MAILVLSERARVLWLLACARRSSRRTSATKRRAQAVPATRPAARLRAERIKLVTGGPVAVGAAAPLVAGAAAPLAAGAATPLAARGAALLKPDVCFDQSQRPSSAHNYPKA